VDGDGVGRRVGGGEWGGWWGGRECGGVRERGERGEGGEGWRWVGGGGGEQEGI